MMKALLKEESCMTGYIWRGRSLTSSRVWITSIENTNETMVEIDAPVLRVTEIEKEAPTEPVRDPKIGGNSLRSGEVLKRLRLGHLNEERKDIEKTCSDYQDIFIFTRRKQYQSRQA